MGNCFAGSRGLVHPATQPSPAAEGKAAGEPSLVRFRMTRREFEELLGRAESRKRDPGAAVGVLILEGLRQGRWEAVGVCGGGGDHLRNVATTLATIPEGDD